MLTRPCPRRALPGFPALLLGLAALLPACAGDAPASFATNCHVPPPSAEAVRPAGPHAAEGDAPAGWIQPGGRDLLPMGRLIPVGGFPLSVRVLPPPYERYVVTSSAGHGDNMLTLVEPNAADADRGVVSVVPYKRMGGATSPGLFYGLQVGRLFGVRIFAAGGGYEVPSKEDPNHPAHVVDVIGVTGTPPVLTQQDRVLLTGGALGLPFPAGLWLSADERSLYVVGQRDSSLTIVNVDPADGPGFGKRIGVVYDLGLYPHDVVVDEMQGRAYVSLWGGEALGGTPPMFRDGLLAVDLSQPAQPRRVSDAGLDMLLGTGKGSEQLILSGRRIYVAAADADKVTALDLDGLTMPLSQGVRLPDAELLGASPNALAIDEARGRLYVADARDNRLSVLSLPGLLPIGSLTTAAYPTGVAVLGEGTVVVTCAKGVGTYPTDKAPQDGNLFEGLVQVIPRPSEQDLARGDALSVRADRRPQAYQVTPTCDGEPRRFPLPVRTGDETPIKHVFFILKENKTYDALLGDLAGARGQKDMVLFGEEVTPNLHALARRFSHLDNFYANADQSLQGHEWASGAFANDFIEKAWLQNGGRGTRPDGDFGGSYAHERAGLGGGGSLFQAMTRAGISFHTYGEITNLIGGGGKLDPAYPGLVFTLEVRDVDRADYIVSRLTDPDVGIERFHYIILPNDHTHGTSPGALTPESLVADNDEGLGRIIDGLSHSRYWQDSIVFVIEDDPADGYDHIDEHRSICLVISPWVKQGYVSSVNYDDPALWRTMGLLLGLPPVNSLVGSSAAMYDLFASEPDPTPYTFIPRRVPVKTNPMSAPMAAESMAIDWSRPDTAPLGEILWRAVRGTAPPFPTRPSTNDDD